MNSFLRKFRNKLRMFFGVTLYQKNCRKYNIGRHSYLGRHSKIESKETIIGAFCSIGDYVQIGLSQHPFHYLTTHPFLYNAGNANLYGDISLPSERLIKHNTECPVEIGNDVWIGERAMILGGVKIGNGAIVGAGAIVTKDVPDYAIVAGVPAKVLRYRFSPELIKELDELQWWTLSDDFIKTLPLDNPEECVRILKE